MTVLVIAPHPDDEILGCGGVIAKRAEAGDDVWVCIVSEGKRPMYSRKFIEQEFKEMQIAHSNVGVGHFIRIALPTARLDTIPQYRLNEILADVVDVVRPDEVFIPHRGDMHRDHQIVADAAMVALRPNGSNNVKRILAYEVLSETDWNIPNTQNAFIPNVYEDITKQINFKLIGKKKVVRITTEFDCSKRREAWMISLGAIIAENFCCQSYRSKHYNKQVATICFIGLEGDVEACAEIFKYAVGCIRSGINDLRKKTADCSREYRKRLCDGYGFGYTQGIREAFEAQKEHDETGWGLVMTVSKDVTDETNGMKREKFKSAAMEQMSAKGFAQGNDDGKKFDPGTKLEGTSEKKMALGGM